MDRKPETAGDLIDGLGGTHEVASLLSVSAQAVCNMRSRGQVPPRHWPTLIREAANRSLPGVTLDWLAGLTPDDAPRPKRRRGSQAEVHL